MKKFNELTNELSLVDFYTTWCGPCRMLAPILEQIEGIDVIKVDVEEERDLGMKYNINVVPTLILFKNKEEVSRKQGYMDLNELNSWINKYK